MSKHIVALLLVCETLKEYFDNDTPVQPHSDVACDFLAALAKVKMPPPMTAEEIDSHKSPRGGWTKEALASLGISYPPPKGWRKRLMGRRE